MMIYKILAATVHTVASYGTIIFVSKALQIPKNFIQKVPNQPIPVDKNFESSLPPIPFICSSANIVFDYFNSLSHRDVFDVSIIFPFFYEVKHPLQYPWGNTRRCPARGGRAAAGGPGE